MKNWMLQLNIDHPKDQISYKEKIMLIGSCFSEGIGERMREAKFKILQNPNGIIFDPGSICKTIKNALSGKIYDIKELYFHDGLWHSWDHHSVFSDMDPEHVLEKINRSVTTAHNYLKEANWVIISFGTAWYYILKHNLHSVANCHKVPSVLFDKHLAETLDIINLYTDLVRDIYNFNPQLKIIYTISPVRHIRDGIIENNQSKSRLIDAVHTLVKNNDNSYYFPSYEYIIDVLRDYRFYDNDMVHPSPQATDFVFERFMDIFINNESKEIYNEVKKWLLYKYHRPHHPSSEAHRKFLENYQQTTEKLKVKYPFIDFD